MTEQFKYPWGKGRIRTYYEATANDNDKTFTVPDDKIVFPMEIYVQYSASADVGNRQPLLIITDGTNVIRTVGLIANLTASQTSVLAMSANANITVSSRKLLGSTGGITAGWGDALPNGYYLPGGYTVRIYDGNSVTANDDIVFIIHYIEYDA